MAAVRPILVIVGLTWSLQRCVSILINETLLIFDFLPFDSYSKSLATKSCMQLHSYICMSHIAHARVLNESVYRGII